MAFLSKEEFVKVINELEKRVRFEVSLEELYNDFGGSAPWSPNGRLMDEIIHTLNVMFDLEETSTYGSDIDYFVYDLDFGQNPDDLYIEDEEGNKTYLTTAEELYDYIMEQKEKENK